MNAYKAAMDKFLYNADTGNFYHSDGKLAGYKNKSSGYWLLSIRDNGKRKILYGHRLAFLIYFGYLPDEVDHINRCRDDNKIKNLRAATRFQNSCNTSRVNKYGCVGVSWNKGKSKYDSRIQINGKNTFLGRFKDLDEAIKCRKDAEVKYYGEFSPKI